MPNALLGTWVMYGGGVFIVHAVDYFQNTVDLQSDRNTTVLDVPLETIKPYEGWHQL